MHFKSLQFHSFIHSFIHSFTHTQYGSTVLPPVAGKVNKHTCKRTAYNRFTKLILLAQPDELTSNFM